MVLPIHRLEQYCLRYPQEILQVTALKDKQEEIILIFKGFSSFLTHSTPVDPEIPLLGAEDAILAIDRLASPYTLQNPLYLEEGLSWPVMEQRLADLGL